MPVGETFLDITELFDRPLRTGIQRVERELIRHWPAADPAVGALVLCAYDPEIDALRVLPGEARAILTAPPQIDRLTIAEERAALHALLHRKPPVPVPPDAGPLLNAELFFDPLRAGFYERLAARGRTDICWLVYDFLPYLEPDWFEQGTGRVAMPYLHALRHIPRVAFISEHTRQDYLRRVMRSRERDGPVVALGGDGLGLEAQHFSPGRDSYVTLGSVEPRKRVAAVLEGFQTLWREGSEARLTVIGRVLPQATREIALLEALQAQPLFRHLPDASDTAVRDALRRARALLFASEGEGFGLPPFESLFCGIPVVVGPGIPSIEMLPPEGQIRLDRISPEAIAGAVRRLQDDGQAAQLWSDAGTLRLPLWSDFARDLAQWSGAARTGAG